ncbi:hypothetical protein RD110_00775 [Rhodoferax koreense]|uniref:TonB C-terminal domain-containing protein n=1 Tax=Rhodoferax koreensis TaxID=1842727 RepID=A0A1P8JQC3_9BURK|nr:energy transducer TonB [Rhodoferax koreense]APW35925.1 hypothetical protein RD110_00775 [Rhodoferax koreense]
MRVFNVRVAAVLIAAALAGCASTDPQPWPAKVVSVDQMKVLTPIRMKFIHTSEEKSGVLTTVLVVHVDAQGKAVRSRVEQSSGHARVDEAAKLALLEARFAPYTVDGAPEAVSVVMPMHVPVKKL